MFQNQRHDFEMKSQGNKTNQVLLERGDGIHNLFFSWCHFASTATLAGGKGLDFGQVHRKHHCINPVEVVKCLAMQSVMSQTSFFCHDISGHCCKSRGCQSPGLSPQLFFCLKTKKRKPHRSGETPKGKSALVAERPVEILKEGFDSKRCSCAA